MTHTSLRKFAACLFAVVSLAVFSRIAAGSEAPRSFIEYNLLTGTTVVRQALPAGALPTSIPEFKGVDLPDTDNDNDDNSVGKLDNTITDNRQKVTVTTRYPASTICEVVAYFHNSPPQHGSGAIVGRSDGNGFHCVTVAHTFFSPTKETAKCVLVVPGLNGKKVPYGFCYATTIRMEADYATDQYDHDFALLTLNSTVGNQTGWMGMAAYDPTDPTYSLILNLDGYPGDLSPSTDTQYFDTGLGAGADENILYHHIFAAGGESGAPIWSFYPSTNARYILGVHFGNQAAQNVATRLSSTRLQEMITWMNSDPLPTPLPAPIGLTHGVPQTGSTATGNQLYYVDVPTHATMLSIQTSGTSGDVLDLGVNAPQQKIYPVIVPYSGSKGVGFTDSGDEGVQVGDGNQSIKPGRYMILVSQVGSGGSFSIVANVAAYKIKPPTVSSRLTASANPIIKRTAGKFSATFNVAVENPSGGTLDYQWDFGDGTTQAGTSSISHAFTAQGMYEVKVAVSAANMEPMTETITVQVGKSGKAKGRH